MCKYLRYSEFFEIRTNCCKNLLNFREFPQSWKSRSIFQVGDFFFFSNVSDFYLEMSLKIRLADLFWKYPTLSEIWGLPLSEKLLYCILLFSVVAITRVDGLRRYQWQIFCLFFFYKELCGVIYLKCLSSIRHLIYFYHTIISGVLSWSL